jgi:phycobilisome rod-core linker protein
MTIPLLTYTPSSQNQRVEGFDIPGEEQPRIFTTETASSNSEIDSLIRAAYRQIFNEQQMLKANQQRELESQLRNGQINVKDFIRGLLLSDSFRRRNYDVSNNYRFAQMCVQRVLGRDVYSDREKISWSIVIATKGIAGFVDELLNSEEYLANFGLDTVPFQRRRILAQHVEGALPFARMPRYGADHREELKAMGYFLPVEEPWVAPAWVTMVGKVVTFGGAGILTLLVIAVALAAFEIISL